MPKNRKEIAGATPGKGAGHPNPLCRPWKSYYVAASSKQVVEDVNRRAKILLTEVTGAVEMTPGAL